jgi:hypothetical protein
MASEGVLLDIAAAVADGSSVDWDALERQAATDQDRRIVRSLRMVAQVGEVHGSTEPGPPAGAAALETLRDATLARSDASIEAWGRYELQAKLGEGAQGAVYKAWDPQLECEVALKILQPDVAATDPLGERVLREGRALARVRHPNVVNVYGVETHGTRIALCMEFIRGRTLDELMRSQGPFGAQEAVTVGVAVGRALAAVHASGLVHRDVKTRNVMREEKGRIVLMDFGTGHDHALLARAGAGDLAGTPIYMAPEVLLGSPASQLSDVYSVGVLLYHLVSGRYPVEGRTLEEIVVAHRRGTRSALAERRPDLPDGFIRVVDRATAPDPALRYGSVGQLVHDLVTLEAGEIPQPVRSRGAVEHLLGVVAWLGAAVVGVTVLGFITSMLFNVVLERTSVAGETIVDHFVWGVRSLLAPVFNVAQILILLFAARALWRLLRRVVPALDRGAARVAATVRQAIDRLDLGQPDTFAQVVLVVSLGYLVVVAAMHWSLITAMTTPVSSLRIDQRAWLSPANATQHYAYRSALDWLVLGSGLALYRVKRLRSGRPGTGFLPLLTVAAVFAVACLLWSAPYRLFFQSDRPRLDVGGARCYRLGVDSQGPLVYCPDGSPPRVCRLAEDAAVRDTGITESVFTAP